jgi:hypothetical protein
MNANTQTLLKDITKSIKSGTATACGQREVKVTYLDHDEKKVTSYVRSSKDKFIIQIPAKGMKLFGANIPKKYFQRSTTRQEVYGFETTKELVSQVEMAYKKSIKIKPKAAAKAKPKAKVIPIKK